MNRTFVIALSCFALGVAASSTTATASGPQKCAALSLAGVVMKAEKLQDRATEIPAGWTAVGGASFGSTSTAVVICTDQ